MNWGWWCAYELRGEVLFVGVRHLNCEVHGFIYGCMVLDLRGAFRINMVVYACRNYMRGRGSVGRRNCTPTVAPSQPLLSAALYPTLKIDEPILQNRQCVQTRESGRISNVPWQGGPAESAMRPDKGVRQNQQCTLTRRSGYHGINMVLDKIHRLRFAIPWHRWKKCAVE